MDHVSGGQGAADAALVVQLGRDLPWRIHENTFGRNVALPPLASATFRPEGIAYDLAYVGMTPFLGLARAAGVGCVVDCMGMLVEQAADAFAWCRGIGPDTRGMIEALTIPLV